MHYLCFPVIFILVTPCRSRNAVNTPAQRLLTLAVTWPLLVVILMNVRCNMNEENHITFYQGRRIVDTDGKVYNKCTTKRANGRTSGQIDGLTDVGDCITCLANAIDNNIETKKKITLHTRVKMYMCTVLFSFLDLMLCNN